MRRLIPRRAIFGLITGLGVLGGCPAPEAELVSPAGEAPSDTPTPTAPDTAANSVPNELALASALEANATLTVTSSPTPFQPQYIPDYGNLIAFTDDPLGGPTTPPAPPASPNPPSPEAGAGQYTATINGTRQSIVTIVEYPNDEYQPGDEWVLNVDEVLPARVDISPQLELVGFSLKGYLFAPVDFVAVGALGQTTVVTGNANGVDGAPDDWPYRVELTVVGKTGTVSGAAVEMQLQLAAGKKGTWRGDGLARVQLSYDALGAQTSFFVDYDILAAIPEDNVQINMRQIYQFSGVLN